MNAPDDDDDDDDDRSSGGPKYIFERHEEKKIRRRLIMSALFFDFFAVAVIIALCVGGWTRSNEGWATTTMSEDSHLVTWSAAYRRSETGLQSTFIVSWFLSSTCYSEHNNNNDFAQGGCIHRKPGSPFNLGNIMNEIEIKLVETDSAYYGAGVEGMFEGLEDVDLSSAVTITSSRDAVASYVVFLVLCLGAWMCHGFVKRNSIAIKLNTWRVMACTQALAAIALLVASALTTASALKANAVLENYGSVFEYHSSGTSFKAMTWCAFGSHLFSLLAYFGSIFMWQRLQRPELYPPEPEPEPGAVPLAVAGFGENRRNRRDAPVHREHDPNSVDDELPPYSRVDPIGMSMSMSGRRSPRGSGAPPGSDEDIELGPMGGHGDMHGVDMTVPAPDYELHARPSDRAGA